jgi:hypothetical protein
MAYLPTNSTNTLLLANQEFTGEAVAVDKEYISVTCSFNSNVGGVLEFFHSIDGFAFSNYADIYDFTTNPGSHSIEVSVKGKYFKVRYINGNQNQGVFNLFCKLNVTVGEAILNATYDTITVFAGGENGFNIRELTIDDEITIPTLNKVLTSDSGVSCLQVKVISAPPIVIPPITLADVNIRDSNGNDILSNSSGFLQTQIMNSSLTVNTISGFATSAAQTTAQASLNSLVTGTRIQASNGNLITCDSSNNLNVAVSNFSSGITHVYIDNDFVVVEPIDTTISEAPYDLLLNGPTLWADSTPLVNPFFADPNGREGWYYDNFSNIANVSNIYWYANPVTGNLQENDMTFAQLGGMYCIITPDYVENGALTQPIMGVYSQPTGTNDFIPTFAHSRWAYSLSNVNIAKLRKSETIILYTGSTRPQVHLNIPAYQLDLASTNGDALSSEIVAYMTVNTQGTSSKIGYLLQYTGFLNITIGFNREYVFKNSKERVIQNNQFSGSVNVGNFPATQAVSGNVNATVSNFPATQAVSGNVNATVNLISGFNLETTQSAIKTNLDKLNFNTADTNKPLYVDTQLTKINSYLYGSTNGNANSVEIINTDGHNHLLTRLTNDEGTVLNTFASNGGLYVDVKNTAFFAKTQDGSGGNITSSSGTGGKQGLDVNIIGGGSLTNYALETGGNIESIKTQLEKNTYDSNGYLNVHVQNEPIIDATNSSILIYGSDGNTTIGIKTDNQGQILIGNTSITVDGTVSVDSLPNIDAGSNSIQIFGNDGSTTKAIRTNTNGELKTEVTNQISGYALESGGNLALIKTNTDRIKSDGTIGDAIQVAVKNTSIDTHCYASNNGTNWHHLKSDANGILNVHSRTEDGAGNDITSTEIGAVRALDVNLAGGSVTVDSVKIKDSSGNNINAVTGDGTKSGALKVQSIGGTNNANIADINAIYAGTTYTSQANFISNGYETPVCIGGWSGSGTSHNVVKVSTSNALLTGFSTDANTIKIDTLNNTVGLSTSGNTVKIDPSSNSVISNIKDTAGSAITSLTTPSNCVGAIKTALYGTVTNNAIGDTSAAPHGVVKVGLNNFIVNSYSLPVMCGGFDGTNTQGFKTNTSGSQYVAFDTANNTIKIDTLNNTVGLSTSGNTVKIDTANNTVQFSQTSNQNNIKITDAGGDIATVSTPVVLSGSTTIRGLDSQSYINAYDVYNNVYNNLTMVTDQQQSTLYKALDVYARNPSTQVVNYGQTTVNGLSGLNIYQIYPKKIHYTLCGRSESTSAAVIMGGTGSQRFIYDNTFGKATPQTFSAILAAGSGSPRTLRYHYVNSLGDLKTDGSISVNNSTNTNLTPSNIISINKFWIDGAVGLNEQVLIRVGTVNNAAFTIYSADFDDYYNGVITVPNGYIGYLTQFSPLTPTAMYLYVYKWDENSNRTMVYNHFNGGNVPVCSGSNGSIGGIFTAGESIAFGKSGGGASIYCGNFVLEPI